MGYNGSGVWNRLYNWTNDANNGIKIRADRMDAEMNDMANNGFSAVITCGGQSVITANLPMNGFQHTGAAAATTSGEYLTYAQNQASLGSQLSIGANITAPFGTTGVNLIGNIYTQTDSTTGAGTIAQVFGSKLSGVTWATAANAITITNGYNYYFSNPVAGSHVTLSNGWAAGFDSANVNGIFYVPGGGTGSGNGLLISGQIGSNTVNGVSVYRTDAPFEIQNTAGAGNSTILSIVNAAGPTTKEASVAFCSITSSNFKTEICSFGGARFVNNDNTSTSWRGVGGISPLAANGASSTFEPPALYCFANTTNAASISLLYNGAGDARDHPPADGLVHNYQNFQNDGTLTTGAGGSGNVTSLLTINGSSASAFGPVLVLQNNGSNMGLFGDYAYIAGSATHQVAAQCGGSGGVFLASGATAWSAISSEKWKNIEEAIDNPLERLMAIRGVFGCYKKGAPGHPDNDGPRKPFLIAEDMQKALPEAVTQTAEGPGVEYTGAIPLMIEAIKALLARVQVLEAGHV